MESNMSYRLSGTGYDTAAEDSISMYYSFNGTAEDKTLENSDLDSTVEIDTTEETIHTVVKVPPTPPVAKGKCGRSLLLNTVSSSTPSGTQRPMNTDQTTTENLKIAETETIVHLDGEPVAKSKTVDISIVESFSKLQIETVTITDNSVEIIEESNEIKENAKPDSEVLKDASTKIWSNLNQMETIVEAKNISDNKSHSKSETVKEIISSELESAMAEKLMEDIRSLLQVGVKTKAQTAGKENKQENLIESNKPEAGKLSSNAGAKVTGIKKPSRLSTFNPRRSILQTETQSSTKSITPATRISSRQSFSGTQMHQTTARDALNSNSNKLNLQNQDIEKNAVRRSMLPNKRMSIMNVAKSTLTAIVEKSQGGTPGKKLANKQRLSLYGSKSKLASIKNEPRFVAVVKTTLSSPVMGRKDSARRSINKCANPASVNLTKSRVSGVVPRTKSEPTKSSSYPSTLHPVSSEKSTPVEFGKVAIMPRKDFICEICSRSFRVSSIFEAHKKSHNQSSRGIAKNSNTCKFCDKSFAISKALDKHLLENCLKIPLAEKKKIKIADEESRNVEALATTSSLSNRNRDRLQHRVSIVPASRKSIASRLMPPPTTTKLVKKSVAHAGVLKTPNKMVKCKPCEKTFDNVLSFAEHVLSHSNSSLGEE